VSNCKGKPSTRHFESRFLTYHSVYDCGYKNRPMLRTTLEADLKGIGGKGGDCPRFAQKGGGEKGERK